MVPISKSPDQPKLGYGLKPEVWGRVGPDPWAELQVDPAGLRAGLTWSEI